MPLLPRREEDEVIWAEIDDANDSVSLDGKDIAGRRVGTFVMD
jgi:hypothetical protein